MNDCVSFTEIKVPVLSEVEYRKHLAIISKPELEDSDHIVLKGNSTGGRER